MKILITALLLIASVKAQSLSCTCHGGPGNYPYDCEPVQKTCHGGPGNYPYPCWVCPE